MALQEFLASYAVEVDEAGAKRLKDVLAENRDGAAETAASFRAAGEAVAALRSVLAEPAWEAAGSLTSFLSDLRGGAEGENPIRLPVGLDLAEAEASASFFTAKMESLRPGLSVNTSGITAAVSAAVASVRSMLSSLQVTVPVRAVVQAGAVRGNTHGTTVPGYASGARVDSPTLAVIGEGGAPEYVIPARDERALPLLRSLLGELSDSARRKFLADFSGLPGTPAAANGTGPPGEVSLRDLSSLPSELAALAASARNHFLPGGAPAGSSYRSLEAPVNITVAAASTSPEAVGRSVYDLASRHLLRTMEGVFG